MMYFQFVNKKTTKTIRAYNLDYVAVNTIESKKYHRLQRFIDIFHKPIEGKSTWKDIYKLDKTIVYPL